MNRRVPLWASLAAMVTSLLVPYTVWAHGEPVGGLRSASPTTSPVVLEIDAAPPVRPAEPADHSLPFETPHEHEQEHQPAGPHGPAGEPAPDPEGLVRDVHVLHSYTQMPTTMPLEAEDTGECPSAVTCPVHQVRSARFPADDDDNVNITWHFNDDGRRHLRAPAGLLEEAMAWATAEWSRWSPRVSFTYGGTTDATFGARGEDGTCADGTNVVTWERFPASVIAAVVTCYDPQTGTVLDADLALNVTQHWEDIVGEPSKRHTFDIKSIVTHEIGHWLSLEDGYTLDGAKQTMFGHASYGETHKRTLALGDIIGLQAVYPCGDGDSCPRDGIVDD